MRFLILVFCFLIISCATVSESSKKQEDYFGIEDGSLVYDGRITEVSNEVIFTAYRDSEVKPTRLLIASRGGEIGAGMELGNWVRSNSLDVEVTTVCASSCANYVFPAGRTKYLRKDSILLWHGSAWQANSDDSEYMTSMREQETNFFDDIEVDNLLCTYGQSKFTFWDYLKNAFGKGTEGYDYSLSDLERFGLSNIVLLDGEWNWRKYRPHQVDWVKRVEVDDDYNFMLRRFEI